MTEQFDRIWARFQPTRTDDLRRGTCPIGHVCEWEAQWMIEEGTYAGDWAWLPTEIQPFHGWVPSRDLVPLDYQECAE